MTRARLARTPGPAPGSAIAPGTILCPSAVPLCFSQAARRFGAGRLGRSPLGARGTGEGVAGCAADPRGGGSCSAAERPFAMTQGSPTGAAAGGAGTRLPARPHSGVAAAGAQGPRTLPQRDAVPGDRGGSADDPADAGGESYHLRNRLALEAIFQASPAAAGLLRPEQDGCCSAPVRR